ncbi:MAG: mannose-1-phosphate guanylyltransferase [Rickettsiaceae bacterium]|nr:mannose-1-phosphate guanylyltransferase [Rickettsiaceae bacterium]
MEIQTVIIAGGLGSRLWPISYQENPKQFIKILGDKSSFQQTALRNKHLGDTIVIVNNCHIEIAKRQLEEIAVNAKIIVEPLQRNTAICGIIAAIYAKERNCDKVAFLPADHHITDLASYRKSLKKIIKSLQKSNISIIGIKPTLPHTGYGYIQVGNKIEPGIYQARKFIEKPPLNMAQKFIVQANYFWNSGMFFYHADFMLLQARKYLPKMLNAAYKAITNSTKVKNYIILAKKPYSKIKSISLDYGIIEQIKNMALIKAEFSWSDLGSWDSLWKLRNKDHNDNCIEGNITTDQVTNSYIKTDNKAVVVGLDNIIIVDHEDKLLVADRSKSESLKDLVGKFTVK